MLGGGWIWEGQRRRGGAGQEGSGEREKGTGASEGRSAEAARVGGAGASGPGWHEARPVKVATAD